MYAFVYAYVCVACVRGMLFDVYVYVWYVVCGPYLICVFAVLELSKNPVDGFSVGLKDDSDIYEWQCMMEGPAGTD